MWDNIKSILGTSAPVLGTLIGGPMGGAVGGLISKALGVENTPEAIELALTNNPDALVRLRELEVSKEIAILEAEHKARLSEIESKRVDNERTGMFLNDVSNARGLQIESLKQDDKFSKRFVYILASSWSVFAMVYIAFITFGNIPEANVRFADTILGFLLGTIVATIINFFLGTSDKQVEQQLPPELIKAIEELKKKHLGEQ